MLLREGIPQWSVSTKNPERELFTYLAVHLLEVCQGTPFSHERVLSWVLQTVSNAWAEPWVCRTLPVMETVRARNAIHTKPLLSVQRLQPRIPAWHLEKYSNSRGWSGASLTRQVCQSQALWSSWQREAKQTNLGLYEYRWLSMCFLVFLMYLGLGKVMFQDTVVC